jgi:hypothetical protein
MWLFAIASVLDVRATLYSLRNLTICIEFVLGDATAALESNMDCLECELGEYDLSASLPI